MPQLLIDQQTSWKKALSAKAPGLGLGSGFLSPFRVFE